jgi:16S rRNA G966 N2-methylase RsmD
MARRYDRAFLLSPEKRNQVMALWEVRRYGLDSFADADYTRLYGLAPTEWYARGVRLLARTTAECVRDALGDCIGQEIAHVVALAPRVPGVTVIDPFAGSCNVLYWILRRLPSARGVAFELDPTICAMTRANLASADVKTPIDLRCGDYRALVLTCPVPADQFVVVFISPPWGDALDALTGLDLRRTRPSLPEILATLDGVYRDQPILYVIQVRQPLDLSALTELASQFEWSQLRIYDINIEGMKPGVLLASRRWKPDQERTTTSGTGTATSDGEEGDG